MGFKNILAVLALFFAAACVSKDSAQMPGIEPLPMRKRLLVAVTDFKDNTQGAQYFSFLSKSTGDMVYELQRTGCFRIIERQRLKVLLNEHKLNITELVDPATVKKAGKLIGIEAVLLGDLALIREEKNNVAGVVKDTRETIEVILTARLVAIDTGEILAAAKKSVVTHNTFSDIAGGAVKSGQALDTKNLARKALAEFAPVMARQMALQILSRR